MEFNITENKLDHVLNLDISNFTETISKHEFIAVHFHASRYSEKFASEYAKAASVLSNNDPPLVLAQVDIDKEVNRELHTRFDIRIFPALKIFRDGGNQVEEYEGPHHAVGIAGCLKRLIKSAVQATNLISDEKIASIEEQIDENLKQTHLEDPNYKTPESDTYKGEGFKSTEKSEGQEPATDEKNRSADKKKLNLTEQSVPAPVRQVTLQEAEIQIPLESPGGKRVKSETATVQPPRQLTLEDLTITHEFFHVLNLDHYNFDETIGRHNFIAVHFLARYSEKFAIEYDKAASVLSDHDPPVVLAQVDLEKEVNRELGAKFDIRSFPTVIIFRDGGKKVEKYEGRHYAVGIAGCLKRLAGPFPTEIKSAAEATKLIGDQKIAIIGVFPKLCGEEYDKFIAFAERLRLDYDFGYTMDAKHLPRGETSVSGPVVRLFKPFDELFVDTEDFNDDALMKFVEEASTPVVTLCDHADQNKFPFMAKFFHSRIMDRAMLFTKLSDEGFNDFRSKYCEVAHKYKGRIRFMLGDIDYESSKDAYWRFEVQESEKPMIVIQQKYKRGDVIPIKYVKSNLEPDDIAPWVEDYMAGKLRPYVRSEPIPQENNGPVKVVVGDSIYEMVWESRKNVLLELYTQLKGCEKLDRILDDVGVHFEKDPDVVIAKFDIHTNEIPLKTLKGRLGIRNYYFDPMLYFKTASGKIERYGGDRTKQDIIDFINNKKEDIDIVVF